MYFFVDESGNTGNNLFDEHQPILYYGVLSSIHDLDSLASSYLQKARALLGVDRIHASALGMEKLEQVALHFFRIYQQFTFCFDLHQVVKKDYIVMSFYDQVFDQGVNPAVTWSSYWTPLRYLLLFKLALLFDVGLLQRAWNSRIESDSNLAAAEFLEVCQTLLSRLDRVPDRRSRQLIGDGLSWAMTNFEKLSYNTADRRGAYLISPNLIGFQSVMHGIAKRLKSDEVQGPAIIVVDQQTQFNETQRVLAELFASAKDLQHDFGTGLPIIDFRGMPETPLSFKSGNDSSGLELVDAYLWLLKQALEGRDITPRLHRLLETQIKLGNSRVISLASLEDEWAEWFASLEGPSSEEQMEVARKMVETDEKRRLAAIAKGRRKSN